jgi:eukaryotic-like serine/threonine-protein kinase
MTDASPEMLSIFAGALERPQPEERAAFLDAACGRDAELRQRIEALLCAHDEAGGFLKDAPAADRPTATLEDPITERPGAVLGPYKLLEQIGEGGFGVVFMAEQQQPVRRKVALKILKPGMDTKQVIARFEAERQALAILDHPNIAKVLDGGTTTSGRPYFVMDLVRGVPITDYCDHNHLTPRQRLELFIPICQAVQHAHQKGIIHRDLKPSNILVLMHDTTPVPKVIDFGVAKALGQELTDKTLFTGFAQMVGTPLYMSPEQAGQSGLDIDTRSDIYSLGVLLYELLTGTTPFSKERFRQAVYDEIRRIIREEEPPKPSTRLSESKDSLPSISAQRQTEPAKLTRLVRGELDWIVMKALEKDRNRRYETANGFAMDVQRYLTDEPVLAGPPSTSYRLRKFVRRNRRSVLAVGLLILTLVAGIIGTTWGMVEARHRAEGERLAKERAEANFALANEAVEKYLGTVTDDPDLKRADFHRLRKKLLESALPFFQKLTAQKSDDPEVEAGRGRAYERLGLVRHALGENEAAIRDLETSAAIFARLNADFPTVPAYRHGLAETLNQMGYCLRHLGKRGETEAAYRQAQGIYEKLAAEFPAEPKYRQGLAHSHDGLGNLLRETKREEAEAAYRLALDIQAKLAVEFPTTPAYRMELAQTHNNLGWLLADLGRSEQAAAAFAQALAIQEKVVTEFPAEPSYRFELARGHYNLGILLLNLRKHQEAEAASRQAAGIHEKLAAEFPTVPECRDALARSHNHLGIALSGQGKHPEAEAAYRQAVGIYEKLATGFPTVPEYRQALAQSYENLGNALSDLGKLREAEAAYRQSLDIQEKLVAEFPTDPRYDVGFGGSYCNFGVLVRDSGQPEAALAWFQKAIARLEAVLAKEPRLVEARQFLCNSHMGRAQALDNLGRHAEATRDWERALELDYGHDKEFLRSHLAESRLRGFRKDKDSAGCLAAAAEYEALKPTDAEGLYDAACHRAVCAAVVREDPKTPAADAPRLAKEQADLAMAWLQKAVAAGFTDAEHMKQDKDFDALREREDFKKLVAELQAKKK